MKQNLKDNSSRRRFLSLGLLSGAALLTQKAEAMASVTDDDEKVSMLTADGKLVEVSKKLVEQSTSREKAKNEDILNWTESAKKSMP
ncbi:MAG: hypothetical protein IPL92_08625 [Saprospiraceae bacterium]|nr:hypothetical protein [Candidatus Opimibacter iunctus]